MSDLKLSIALTTYNHEAFIGKALDSILSQKVNFKYEIVIGEDNSSDNTRKIILSYIEKYNDKIKLLESNNNLGYTKNFDLTLRECKGEYIAIFDGDDIMSPGKLQKQVTFLDNNFDFVMVGHLVNSFDSETGYIINQLGPSRKKTFYTIEDLIKYGSFFANSSKMFRRIDLPISGIDYNIKYIADWYITMEIVKNKKIGIIWEILSDYRVHTNSIMKSLKGKDNFRDLIYIINKISKKYKVKKLKFNRIISYAYFLYGLDDILNYKHFSGRKKIMKSILYNPYVITRYFYLILTVFPKSVIKFVLKFKY